DCQFLDDCHVCPPALTNTCASHGGSWANDHVAYGTLGLSCQAICNKPGPGIFAAVCGNPSTGECDLQDACDGSGHCINRSMPSGWACGSQLSNECTQPDTCNGGGSCL